MRTWLLIVIVFALGLSGCAISPNRGDAASIDSCQSGSFCTVTGKLRLHQGQPAWAALVVSGDSCAKLALPDDFYAAAAQWNGAVVEVTGQAFAQPGFDDGDLITLWYTERGRKLSMGMCDGGVGIYVESMHSRRGRSWPSDLSAPSK